MAKLTLKDLQYLNYRKNAQLRQALRLFAVTLTTPLYLYAWINTLLPALVLNSIRKKIKDPQFISSVTFVGYYVLFPIAHALQALVFRLATGSAILSLAYLATLPLSFLLSLWWKEAIHSLLVNHKLARIDGDVKEQIGKISILTEIDF